MKPEDQIENICRRLMTEIKIASIGGFALAASANVAVFNTHSAKLVALPGVSVLGVGLLGLAIDAVRFRNVHRQCPDDDPERENIESEAEVIDIGSNEKIIPFQAEAA